MPWVTLDLTFPHEMMDALTDFCIEHGSKGVIVRDDDPTVAGLTAYFPTEQWDTVRFELQECLARLRHIFPELPSPIAASMPLTEEDWAVSWKAYFKSLPLGRHFIVTPPWLRPNPGERHVIVIDPAEAFGTGTHETTQGCLALLEEAVHDIAKTGAPFTMLDVGCGSGILAIAACKLGAVKVRAVDNDSKAIESAIRNVALNQGSDKIHLQCLSLEEITDEEDIVTANLDWLTILANQKRLAALFRKFLIVSGVTLDQWDEVKKELATEDVLLISEIARTEWGAGLFGRKT